MRAACPTCTITHSARSCACPAAWVHWSSVVTSHNGVGAWGRGRKGSGHATSRVGLLVLAFREYVAEDVHEGRWRMVRRPPRGGGQAVPAAVAPDVEVQAVRGHPWAGVGVLLSPRGVDESQAGVRVPVVWKRWARASRHPGWLVGPCSWRQ